MIHLDGVVVFDCDAEVVHPSLKIGPDFPVPVVQRNAPAAACKTAQFRLEACNGFLRDSKPLSSEGESEERRLLCFDHPAFVPVDLHLENFFKVSADTFHHTISGAFRFHQYDEVIGIPGELMPPPLQFLIEIVQKDIAQQFDWFIGTMLIVESAAFIAGCMLFTVLGCRVGSRTKGSG